MMNYSAYMQCDFTIVFAALETCVSYSRNNVQLGVLLTVSLFVAKIWLLEVDSFLFSLTVSFGVSLCCKDLAARSTFISILTHSIIWLILVLYG
jgi:hypothetical protein